MIVLAALLVAFAAPQTSAATTGRLSGRVTLEGASTPIASARVILLPGGPRAGQFGPPPQAMTDQEGRFAFDRVAPGDYRVQVQKNGYASTMEANPGVAVHLAAGQTIDNLDLHLQKGAVIAGRVLDALGEPVTDVRVMAMRHLESRGRDAMAIGWVPSGPGAQTNDLGEYRVSGLAAGDYIIVATPQMMGIALGAAGIAAPTARASASKTITTSTFYPGTTDQAAAQPITVSAGGEVGNITFTMQSAPTFRVSGVVVDENGAAVAGAFVMLVHDPRGGGVFLGGPPLNGQSRDDGRFTIEGATAGTYRATASIPITTGGIPVTGGVVGGVVGGLVNGGIATWSVGGGTAMPQQTDVVVGDANVTGVRVVVRRPS